MSSLLSETTTRSAIARVVLNNPDGKLRPGLFVTAKISVRDIDVPVVVPKTALKNIENKTVTFIRKEGGFEPKIVKRGRVDNSHVEILSGLQAGERFAVRWLVYPQSRDGEKQSHGRSLNKGKNLQFASRLVINA